VVWVFALTVRKETPEAMTLNSNKAKMAKTMVQLSCFIPFSPIAAKS
jgi:hypothetical protein